MSDDDLLSDLFNILDADGGGSLSVDEFRRLCVSMPSVNDAELRSLLGEADADGSGEIEIDEFGTVIRGLAKGESLSTFVPSLKQSLVTALEEFRRRKAMFEGNDADSHKKQLGQWSKGPRRSRAASQVSVPAPGPNPEELKRLEEEVERLRQAEEERARAEAECTALAERVAALEAQLRDMCDLPKGHDTASAHLCGLPRGHADAWEEDLRRAQADAAEQRTRASVAATENRDLKVQLDSMQKRLATALADSRRDRGDEELERERRKAADRLDRIRELEAELRKARCSTQCTTCAPVADPNSPASPTMRWLCVDCRVWQAAVPPPRGAPDTDLCDLCGRARLRRFCARCRHRCGAHRTECKTCAGALLDVYYHRHLVPKDVLLNLPRRPLGLG
eukprot:TRINITY_DN6278_c0_g1_i1.p1 TRINITY_DN6278_c0_g1~~TRINITY_DN6278_c0_g1_i1.p1  ORF type:complete len:394 (+),score=74.71 TRINITY_DN6278_c0_g1_i1:234-1415(+)